MARRERYWIVGTNGADLGDGNDDGYTIRKAIEEADAWRDATDGPVQVVPVAASSRAVAHLRRLYGRRLTKLELEANALEAQPDE